APPAGRDGKQPCCGDARFIYLNNKLHVRVPVKAGQCGKCGMSRGRPHNANCPYECCPECGGCLATCEGPGPFPPRPAPEDDGQTPVPTPSPPAARDGAQLGRDDEGVIYLDGTPWRRIPVTAQDKCYSCVMPTGMPHDRECPEEVCPRCDELLANCPCE